MRRVKRFIAVGLCAALLAASIQVTTVDVHAETIVTESAQVEGTNTSEEVENDIETGEQVKEASEDIESEEALQTGEHETVQKGNDEKTTDVAENDLMANKTIEESEVEVDSIEATVSDAENASTEATISNAENASTEATVSDMETSDMETSDIEASDEKTSDELTISEDKVIEALSEENIEDMTNEEETSEDSTTEALENGIMLLTVDLEDGVELLHDSFVASDDASLMKDGSFNGCVYTWDSPATETDYLRLHFTVEDETKLTGDWCPIFYIQTFDMNWQGWGGVFVHVTEAQQEENAYTIDIPMETILASLQTGGELQGINICYQNVATSVQLQAAYAVTLPEADQPEADQPEEDKPAADGGEKTSDEILLGENFTASDDATRYKEDGNYDGYLYTWNVPIEADELKLVYTVEDETVLENNTALFYLQPFNTNWGGGWYCNNINNSNSIKDGDVYVATMSAQQVIDTLTDGELAGINVSYTSQAAAASLQLVGLYAVTYVDQSQDDGENQDPGVDNSASLDYVKALGAGWNLGNSFDGVNTALDEEDLLETAWGNPVVVRELIQAVKAKGYDSIRMPMTLYRRFDENNYKIDETWLARYKEVVDWAVEEGLYVMVNIHHDSWLWLSSWDGNKESVEYVKFKALWEQVADYFKDAPEQVFFETINEPTFEATGSISAQDKLDAVNQAAYDAIRNSGGNNDTRMIVIPTLNTNHEDAKSTATYNFIESLDDENIIATVHYYSEWVYSANLGKTGFDEVLWDPNYTPRVSADQFFEQLEKSFLSKGIGVIVGEYGLLGYDSASQVNQAGEELKYYEYMNQKANEYDVCLIFWDNGSGIDRTSGNYHWKKPLVGAMLETSMTERSAYATGLDRFFFTEEATEDIQIPLTLNGATFTGITGLTEGVDYTYDEASATVTIKKEFINKKFAETDGYGTFADLEMTFSQGTAWHEYLIYEAAPVMKEATGTTDSFDIPVEFNASEVRRATAFMSSGRVGPNSSWWEYLQYSGSYMPNYENGTIEILKAFFDDPTVKDGEITFAFEMYDGTTVKYVLTKDGNQVTGKPAEAEKEVTFEWANEICAYVGEGEFKNSYFNIPEGTSIYGTYPWDATSHIELEGWPATYRFGTEEQEDSIKIGLLFTYADKKEYANDITFWLKDAPEVETVEVQANAKQKAIVNNLSEEAIVVYEVADENYAKVSADGTVIGVKAGTTELLVTVSQYGRTDTFSAEITVTAAPESSKPEANESESSKSDSSKSEATSTKPSQTVTIVEEVTALSEKISDMGISFVDMTMNAKKAVLNRALLQKYHGRNMYMMAHLGNGVGFTIDANQSGVIAQDLNLSTAVEKMDSFAEGFQSFHVAPSKEVALGFEVGVHVHVGTEYTGATAYIFAKSLVTGQYQLVKTMTVNEIGNVGVNTNEFTEVMVLIQK